MSDERNGDGNPQAPENGDENDETRAPLPTIEFDAEIKKAIIERLKSRSHSLKVTAILTLVLIVAILAGGGYAVYQANELFSVSLKIPVEDLSEPVARLGEVGTKLEAVLKQARDTVNRISDGESTSPGPNLSSEIVQTERQIGDYQSELGKLTLLVQNTERDLKAADTGVNRASENLQSVKARQEIDLKELDSARNRRDSLAAWLKSNQDNAQSIQNEKLRSEEYNKFLKHYTQIEQDFQQESRDIERGEQRMKETLVSAQNELDAITKRRDELQIAYQNFAGKKFEIESKINTEKNVLSKTINQNELREIYERNKINQLTQITKQINAITSDSNTVISRIDSAIKSVGETEKSVREKTAESGLNATMSTMATRITIVILVLFLVQILVTLYRYNIRLASFYDARIDALDLFTKGSQESFESLVSALSPENLDFGRAPKSPTQQIIDLTNVVSGRGRTTA